MCTAGRREVLYDVKSQVYTGTHIYTRGKIQSEEGETFYVLISSKIADDRR